LTTEEKCKGLPLSSREEEKKEKEREREEKGDSRNPAPQKRIVFSFSPLSCPLQLQLQAKPARAAVLISAFLRFGQLSVYSPYLGSCQPS
jgi:hypothetical protein